MTIVMEHTFSLARRRDSSKCFVTACSALHCLSSRSRSCCLSRSIRSRSISLCLSISRNSISLLSLKQNKNRKVMSKNQCKLEINDINWTIEKYISWMIDQLCIWVSEFYLCSNNNNISTKKEELNNKLLFNWIFVHRFASGIKIYLFLNRFCSMKSQNFYFFLFEL